MNKKIITLVILLAIISILVLIINKIKSHDTLENSQANSQVSNFDFSTQFLKLETNNQNLIYSPLSIKYALKMLNEGASGNTKSQIDSIIGNLSLTQYTSNNLLSLANTVYIRDTYKQYVKKDFQDKLVNLYNAEIQFDSFENANNINSWIENKTLKIIKNMIPDAIVQDINTEMLLINALALDLPWNDSFDCSKTHGEDFYLADGSTMKTTMMFKEVSSDSVSYYKDSQITLLAMDLKETNNTNLEFIAIMPDSDLSNYIKTVSTDNLNNIIDKMTLASKTKSGVEVSIPKFSFEYNLSLKNDLEHLGITDAFCNSADFSNMSNKELYVSDALHKANIDFSEDGIKVAAVTALVMADKTMIAKPTNPEIIKINKPFLYLIRDKNTGEVWFIGTVYEPNSWDLDKSN